MSNYEAIMIIEGQHDAAEDVVIEAWQHLVDTGVCWELQGHYGRMAVNMIEAGILQSAGRVALPGGNR